MDVVWRAAPRLVVMWSLTACGRLEFADHVPVTSPDAVAVDAPTCVAGAAPSMFGTQADVCAPWGGSFQNAGAAVSGTAGAVTVSPSSVVSSGGCTASAAYQTLFLPVRVLDIQVLPSAYTAFQMFDFDGIHATLFKAEGGQLFAIANDGSGEQIIGGAPYDAVQMRWWRLRPTASSIVMETSPDAASWTERAVHAYTPGSGANIVLVAGTNAPEAQSDSATFGDINVCP
jgi:hypothetical protein